MATPLPRAKTPNVAIARVLRGLGLKQGTDFSVSGNGLNGTVVTVKTELAHERVATAQAAIEKRAADEGFPFRVSIHTMPTGAIRTTISNITIAQPVHRPTADALDELIDLVDQVQAEVDDTRIPPGTLLLPETGAEQAPGGIAAKLAKLAAVLNGTQIARAVMSAIIDFPHGCRVTGEDTAGQRRTGTVYRGDEGVVSLPGHANYGRAYVGVVWDDDPGLTHRIPRNRPFTDTLTRI